jgi:hypothetical protein
MRIAIIGGGFFGTFLAYQLGKKDDVTLFEQGTELMGRSALLSLCRLQSGARYPRDAISVAQAGTGYPRFIAEFAPYLRDVKRSTYGLRKEGHFKFNEFKKNLAALPVRYREVPAPPIFKNSDRYETFLEVEEKIILVEQLRTHLISGMKAKVVFRADAIEVNSNRGSIKFRDQTEQKFDRIINTTFTNPNLGLPLEIGFHFAYSIEAFITIDSVSKGTEGATVIDGKFVSLFPDADGRDTLASTSCSTFSRPQNRMEFEDFWKRRIQICKDEKVLDRILADVKSYLDLGAIHDAKLLITPNVKQKTLHTGAASEVRAHGKVISVFCGNYASIYSVLDTITPYIDKARR